MDLDFLETVDVLFGGAEASDIGRLELPDNGSVILETDSERGPVPEPLKLRRREGFRMVLLWRGDISDLWNKNIKK